METSQTLWAQIIITCLWTQIAFFKSTLHIASLMSEYHFDAAILLLG
jgi:hypothetical protein